MATVRFNLRPTNKQCLQNRHGNAVMRKSVASFTIEAAPDRDWIFIDQWAMSKRYQVHEVEAVVAVLQEAIEAAKTADLAPPAMSEADKALRG